MSMTVSDHLLQRLRQWGVYRIGELVLLPAVRVASDETLIVADGFSCREKIAQTTARRGMHIAEVIALAMQSSGKR